MDDSLARSTAPPVPPGRGARDRDPGGRRHLTVLAGERQGDDEPGAAAPPTAALPVLAEIPELGAVLDGVAAADRLLVDAVLQLRPLLAEGRIEATTGVGIEHWLAATARMAGIDRRMLRRLCRLLDRLPALARGAARGQVSFTQLRALTLDLRRAPRVIDDQLDAWLAATIEELPEDADPDALVRVAARAADELASQVRDDEAEEESRFGRSLVIQPNLDGTGGTFFGTEDAIGLAVLDAATAPRRDQLNDVGRARADNLQAHLRAPAATSGDEPRAAAGLHGDPDAASEVAHHAGHAGDIDAAADVAPHAGDAGDPEAAEVVRYTGDLEAPSAAEVPAPAAPTLLLRWDYDALLDHTTTPADILTRLVGGRLRLASDHARRLIAARGTQVRSVIVDDGEVIGVGRAARIPPGWLRDATLAVRDTCAEPLCDRPALGADVDHATPWHREGERPAGATDLDNLGPLCASTNRDRRASGWRVRQTRDGTRAWHHPRSGLTLTNLPATWRPRGAPPPVRHPGPGRGGTVPPHRDAAEDDTIPF